MFRSVATVGSYHYLMDVNGREDGEVVLERFLASLRVEVQGLSGAQVWEGRLLGPDVVLKLL